MARSVVVMAEDQTLERLQRTILGRTDFVVTRARGLSDVAELLRTAPVELVVVEDLGPASNGLLEGLAGTDVHCPVIVIPTRVGRELYPGVVRHVATSPFDPDALSSSVARLLDLPSRRRQRFELALDMELELSHESVTATTVDLSASGVLFESPEPLAVGRTARALLPTLVTHGLGWLDLEVMRHVPRPGQPDLIGATFHDVDEDRLEELIQSELRSS